MFVQLGDARSQVVRETCQIISGLVQNENLKPKLTAATKHLFPALFKLTYVTIKIMSESAMECIDNLVLSLPPAVVLHHLDLPSQDVHAQARGKSAACLAVLLNRMTTFEDIEPLLPGIEELLVRGLEDTSPEARSKARSAFARMQALAPERALVVSAGLKDHVRKQLGALAPSSPGRTKGADPDAPGSKPAMPRLTQRTDFRAARLQFRSKAAGQVQGTPDRPELQPTAGKENAEG
jgi:hypothetical protein